MQSEFAAEQSLHTHGYWFVDIFRTLARQYELARSQARGWDRSPFSPQSEWSLLRAAGLYKFLYTAVASAQKLVDDHPCIDSVVVKEVAETLGAPEYKLQPGQERQPVAVFLDAIINANLLWDLRVAVLAGKPFSYVPRAQGPQLERRSAHGVLFGDGIAPADLLPIGDPMLNSLVTFYGGKVPAPDLPISVRGFIVRPLLNDTSEWGRVLLICESPSLPHALGGLFLIEQDAKGSVLAVKLGPICEALDRRPLGSLVPLGEACLESPPTRLSGGAFSIAGFELN